MLLLVLPCQLSFLLQKTENKYHNLLLCKQWIFQLNIFTNVLNRWQHYKNYMTGKNVYFKNLKLVNETEAIVTGQIFYFTTLIN